MTRECGLLWVWNKEVLSLINMTDNVDRNINSKIYDYHDIGLSSIADVFVLTAANSGVLMVFVFELMMKSSHQTIPRRRKAFTTFYINSFNNRNNINTCIY